MIFKMYTNAHMRFCYKNQWFFNDCEIPGGPLGSIFIFFSESGNITWDQWTMTIFWRYKYSENVMFIERKSCLY